jgi:hypothetical protein
LLFFTFYLTALSHGITLAHYAVVRNTFWLADEEGVEISGIFGKRRYVKWEAVVSVRVGRLGVHMVTSEPEATEYISWTRRSSAKRLAELWAANSAA